MTTEDDLRGTLRAHEDLAPDAAPVAARIAAGVRTRRRHRHAGTAAVAVATAAAVTVPIVLLRDAGPDRGTQAAAPTPTATRPAATTPAAPVVRFGPLTVPFTVPRLPAGWYADGMAYTSPGLARLSYERKGSPAELFVQAWDTKVSGVPAGDVPPTQGPVVRRRLGPTSWLLVAGPLPKPQLEQLLKSVDLRAPEPLTFPFRATWLPAGYAPTGAGSGAHHWYGNSAGETLLADPPKLDAGFTVTRTGTEDTLDVYVGVEDGVWQDKGLNPNGTLLGRPSYYRDEDGYAVLHVYDLQGMHVSINAKLRPGVDRAAIERVAAGLRLVPAPTDPAGWTTRPLP